MILRFLVLVLALSPVVAMANSSEAAEAAHGLDEHTIRTVIYQAINVGIVIALLVYYLRDAVRNFFQDRKAAYVQSAEKAQAAQRQAEEAHLQIKIQLTKLESTSDETISRAKAEAADMRNQMMSEAQALSKKIREEAEASAKNEVEKAKNAIRVKIIHEAAALAANQISQNTSTDAYSHLQKDFVQNVGAVQP